MSHLHLPDGILPPWLWMSGYAVAILVGAVLLHFTKEEKLSRRLPLLGMMSAAMILGASVEIIPIAYHVNLTVMAGILLGPSLIFLSVFVVNVILALFGHGGMTVIGLNTLILSMEGIVGYYLFRFFWIIFKKVTPAIFMATVIALVCSTFAMISVVGLGTSHYEKLIHTKETGMIGFHLPGEKEDHPEGETTKNDIHLKRFMAVILSLGSIGWIIEGMITTFICRYLYRLRPDLLHLEKGPS